MESSLQQNRRFPKHTKNPKRKQQLKVVYISSPVKVNTSASKFRALVQALTGQDADDIPPAFPLLHTNTTAHAAAAGEDGISCGDHRVVHQLPTATSDNSNLSFDDAAYVPEFLENLPAAAAPAAGILPSNMWYD